MFYVVILVIALTFVLHRWVTSKRSDSVTCLIGKTAIVTGGNEGIGYAIVELLASRGCKVIIADKANSEKSVQKIKKLTKNDNVSSKHLDLASFASVRKFADEVKLSEDKVDILINNAGINAYDSVKTEDGLSSVMQVNYFGSFLLTHLLIDKLKKSGQARIVFTGSIAVFLNNLTADNLDRYDFGQTLFGHIYYGNSKYCNVLAAQEFGARLKDYNIMVFAADPGTIKTRIFFVSNDTFWSAFLKKAMLWCFGHEPLVGAQTAFHVATSADLEGKTGGYYFLCRPWIKPWNLRNPEFCRKIWKRSEELVKLRPNEKI